MYNYYLPPLGFQYPINHRGIISRHYCWLPNWVQAKCCKVANPVVCACVCILSDHVQRMFPICLVNTLCMCTAVVARVWQNLSVLEMGGWGALFCDMMLCLYCDSVELLICKGTSRWTYLAGLYNINYYQLKETCKVAVVLQSLYTIMNQCWDKADVTDKI